MTEVEVYREKKAKQWKYITIGLLIIGILVGGAFWLSSMKEKYVAKIQSQAQIEIVQKIVGIMLQCKALPIYINEQGEKITLAALECIRQNDQPTE